jgi:glutamate-1-semialdehyde 2,1-aminomutase
VSRYESSEQLLDEALQVIPLGSQTFSKSLTQYPRGVSPFFIQRGLGAQVWDVDGNQYTDFVNGLLCVSLGYADPDINAAVAKQMESGITFSLPHPLEVEVAKMIVERVPCAEMVRFAKNGTDATSGAIRLARALTNRDHILTSGYHGWQDWSIAVTSKNQGIPGVVRELSHAFPYNNIPALEALFDANPGRVAAVIMEPMNFEMPKPGYLAAVKELAHKHGALLVFDETITGFRFAMGGAQEYLGVTPDLATFGKGVANGFPLAILAGRADLMGRVADIFFSGTFGGETLSLAAAKAVMLKMEKEHVHSKLRELGEFLIQQFNHVVVSSGVEGRISIAGHPSWTIVRYSDWGKYDQFQIKTFVLQELFARGFLSIGTHNLSHSHTTDDVARLVAAYKEIFERLRFHVESNELENHLNCDVIRPLFKIR